jgi:ABC-2 type transport system permease protein
MNSKTRILLKELIKTDFKLRYQGSFFGYLWSVLRPLMLFAIMYVVFIHFLRFGAGIPHFAIALLLGIVLWSFFTETTSLGMQSIVSRGPLIRKISFPKYIIVVSSSISALINLSISLCVVAVFAILDGITITPTIFLLIPILLELYILALGLALFLSTLYVKFRDISNIWDVLIQALFYATPIIYPISMILTTDSLSWAAKLITLSPTTQIIQDARYALLPAATETTWQLSTNPLIQFTPLIITIAIFIISLLYFKNHSKYFAEES